MKEARRYGEKDIPGLRKLTRAAYLIIFLVIIPLFFFSSNTLSLESSGNPTEASPPEAAAPSTKEVTAPDGSQSPSPAAVSHPTSNPDKSAVTAKKRRLPDSISRVKGAGKRLSITFDGGSNDSSAAEILDVLLKKGIKTTFFLTGTFIEKYPELTLRIVEEGHEVGNHTYSHPHLARYMGKRGTKTLNGVDYPFLKRELEEAARLFREVTGREMAPFWRAPYGEINREILRWSSEAGYRHIGWTIDYKRKESMDSLDWVADKRSSFYLTAKEIKERLLAFADERGRAEGGIVLMHLGTERTEDMIHEKLGEIIEAFAARGYELVPVSRLIRGKKTG